MPITIHVHEYPLQEERKLSVKFISEILDVISPKKRLLYDVDYIEQLYPWHQAKECEDTEDWEKALICRGRK